MDGQTESAVAVYAVQAFLVLATKARRLWLIQLANWKIGNLHSERFAHTQSPRFQHLRRIGHAILFQYVANNLRVEQGVRLHEPEKDAFLYLYRQFCCAEFANRLQLQSQIKQFQ